jgi:hypothetical protein
MGVFKKEIRVYAAVLLIYLVVVTLLHWPPVWQMAFFWLGGFFGLLLYNFDHVVYLLWQSPSEEAALKFKELLRQRSFGGMLRLLVETKGERRRLVGHSVIFQAVLVILAYFTLSSTVSFFGKGMVMGLFGYSLIHQGWLFVKGRRLSEWFWQLDLSLTPASEALYYLVLIVLFFLFSWRLI